MSEHGSDSGEWITEVNVEKTKEVEHSCHEHNMVSLSSSIQKARHLTHLNR